MLEKYKFREIASWANMIGPDKLYSYSMTLQNEIKYYDNLGDKRILTIQEYMMLLIVPATS